MNKPVDAGARSAEGDCPCEEAVGHVWDYLDGELDGLECERINEHVARCGTCQGLFANESALKELVARACSRDAAPEELRAWVSERFAAWRVSIRSSRRSR